MSDMRELAKHIRIALPMGCPCIVCQGARDGCDALDKATGHEKRVWAAQANQFGAREPMY